MILKVKVTPVALRLITGNASSILNAEAGTCLPEGVLVCKIKTSHGGRVE